MENIKEDLIYVINILKKINRIADSHDDGEINNKEFVDRVKNYLLEDYYLSDLLEKINK